MSLPVKAPHVFITPIRNKKIKKKHYRFRKDNGNNETDLYLLYFV